MADSVRDIRFLLVISDQRNHFGLRKYRAHAGNLDLLLRRQGDRSQLVQRHFQRPGDHLKEAACSRRALIIHNEVFYLSALA